MPIPHVTHLEHLNLALGIKLKVAVSLEPALDELAELGREAGVVQVVHSESRPRGLGRVSWSDTLLRGADRGSAELDLLEAINDLVEAENEVGSVGDEQPVGAGEA